MFEKRRRKAKAVVCYALKLTGKRGDERGKINILVSANNILVALIARVKSQQTLLFLVGGYIIVNNKWGTAVGVGVTMD